MERVRDEWVAEQIAWMDRHAFYDNSKNLMVLRELLELRKENEALKKRDGVAVTVKGVMFVSNEIQLHACLDGDEWCDAEVIVTIRKEG